MASFSIIGPGAIGTLVGAYLLESGQEVVFIGRRGGRAERLEREGIRVTGLRGEISRNARVVYDSKAGADADFVLVAVKSYDTAAVMAGFASVAWENARFVSLQNGIGNAETIARTVRPERVLIASLTFGAYIDEDGTVHHAGEGDALVGGLKESSFADAERLAGLFQRAGIAVRAEKDIRPVLYTKLAVNCAINPLTALLQVPNGMLQGSDSISAMMKDAVREVVRVADACNISLEFQHVLDIVREVAARTAANRSSMLKDVLEGRRTEIDAICGEVSRLGRENGIDTPVNTSLYRLVKALEETRSGRLARFPAKESGRSEP